jgi:hypothetical protein
MSRYTRYQSVVNKQSDAESSENHWLKQFEDKLQKTSVQPRSQDVSDEINSIMRNSKSRYPSVQAAVDDMMHRSGLSSYLDTVKTSEENTAKQPKKTAQNQAPQPGQTQPVQQQPQQSAPAVDPKTPDVLVQKPSIMKTLQNIIEQSHGNIPVPAVISRLHALHAQDVSDEGAWDDDKLIRLVSKLNLQAKTDNPGSYDNYDNLGRGDNAADSEIDASNTDAFNILMPARF